MDNAKHTLTFANIPILRLLVTTTESKCYDCYEVRRSTTAMFQNRMPTHQGPGSTTPRRKGLARQKGSGAIIGDDMAIVFGKPR